MGLITMDNSQAGPPESDPERTFPTNKFKTKHRISERNNLIHLSSLDCWGPRTPARQLGTKDHQSNLGPATKTEDCLIGAARPPQYTLVHCILVQWVHTAAVDSRS